MAAIFRRIWQILMSSENDRKTGKERNSDLSMSETDLNAGQMTDFEENLYGFGTNVIHMDIEVEDMNKIATGGHPNGKTRWISGRECRET